MIGKYQIEIGPEEFVKGMSTSDYLPDGGFSNKTYGLNLAATPGLLTPTSPATDVSTNISDEFIASCEDASASLSNNRYFVDGSRNYYSYNGTAITKQKTGTTGTYTFGITDMLPFNGKFYTTTTSNITEWNGTTTLDEAYWTTTKSQAALSSGSGQPHPLLVFEKQLWIGDGNKLHAIDTSGTVTNTQIELAPNEAIYALGIDPGTGLMLISTSSSIDLSSSIPAQHYVYFHDGYSAKPRRKVVVDDTVTAFHQTGGIVYVGYGQNIGYWNGNGIEFIRKLNHVSLDLDQLPKKHHFTNIRNTLYVVDGNYVLAFGEVMRGNKIPYYPIKTTNNITVLTAVGANKLGASTATNKFYTYDMNATVSSGGGSAELYSNHIEFPRPVFIHKIRILTTGFTDAAGNSQLIWYDSDNNPVSTYNSYLVTNPGETRFIFDFDFGGHWTQSFKMLLAWGNGLLNVKKIVIYYDVAE